MSRFTYIDINQIKQVLKEDDRWTYQTVGHEVMVQKLFKEPRPDLAIRVYTSINATDGCSRGKGRDAIRIVGIRLPSDRFPGHQPLVKVRRVYRTRGWEANLINAISEIVKVVWDRRDWSPRN